MRGALDVCEDRRYTSWNSRSCWTVCSSRTNARDAMMRPLKTRAYLRKPIRRVLSMLRAERCRLQCRTDPLAAGVLFWSDGMHPSTMPRYDASFSLNVRRQLYLPPRHHHRVHCQESHTRLLWCTRLACQFSTSSQSTSQHDRDQEAARTTR